MVIKAATPFVPAGLPTPGLRDVGTGAVPPHPDTGGLIDWLQRVVLVASSAETIMAGTLTRLRALGIDVRRGHMSSRTLDPQYESMGFTVYADGTAESSHNQHGSHLYHSFRASPFWDLLAYGEAEIARMVGRDERADDALAQPVLCGQRFRLCAGEGTDRYDILQDFAATGGTDYLTYAVAYGFGGVVEPPMNFGIVLSWLGGDPGGFDARAVATLDAITPALAAAVRLPITLSMGDSLLTTYLGDDPASRVFRGDIRRGETETVTAAILFTDLRGFTALADGTPSSDLVALLDDYLGAMADPVEEAGGQVLKFLGDGLLATFTDADEGPEATCARALTAVAGIQAACDRVSKDRAASGRPALLTDIALHFGAISYGNVGSQRRLDFTVVGPAVNEAARIEALCKQIGETALASSSFVAAAGRPAAFRSVGEHELPGVATPRTLYALARPG